MHQFIFICNKDLKTSRNLNYFLPGIVFQLQFVKLVAVEYFQE